MSQRPAAASVPDRQPLDEHAASSVLAYVEGQPAKVDVLASVPEDTAVHGYPSPEAGMLRETARDAHLARLADGQPRVA
ncbi:hypothetical protein KPP03845_107308 [Streptomyces xanthophaeus]|uniref:hypothetical protein n=1 Tax=Streptomyces xanthophaeus TaxID=67385 RepID=UPI00233EF0AE|nr:hypothetical protein [Streptomyces xanthophaeus]WCD90879.1 hypothetical protein KPP03845_107308 [Streptomyces xanthophaeus]